MWGLRKALMLVLLIMGFYSEPKMPKAKPKHVIGTTKVHGFFAAFIIALGHIEWCEKHGYDPVVYWDEQSPYFQTGGYNGSTNVWEFFLEPISHARYQHGDTIFRSPLTPDGKFAVSRIFECCYDKNKTNGCREMKRLIDKYIRVKTLTRKKIEDFWQRHIKGKPTVAVHLRGTDKSVEYDSVSPEVVLQEANKFANQGYQFFIATDEERLLELAKRSLNGPVVSYDSHRSQNGQAIHAQAGALGYAALAAEEILIEALLLSKCDMLIHTCSNVTTAALCFNPDIERIVFPPTSGFKGVGL